ncbi:MAG: hypothetical protein HOP29_19830 [Phycisphaerales bacterium]|nr:hypothetical protein [Phycisphaerales bacterium]
MTPRRKRKSSGWVAAVWLAVGLVSAAFAGDVAGQQAAPSKQQTRSGQRQSAPTQPAPSQSEPSQAEPKQETDEEKAAREAKEARVLQDLIEQAERSRAANDTSGQAANEGIGPATEGADRHATGDAGLVSADDEGPLQLKLSGNDVSVETLETGELVIIGNDEDIKVLERFIGRIDREPAEKEYVLHTLKSASAEKVAEKLKDIVEELWPASPDLPDQRITVIAVSTNVVLITGPPTRMERIIEIADAIDEVEESIPKFTTMKFFIKNRRATEVVDQLKLIVERLRKKQEGQEEINIEVNDADNSVMVFGPESMRQQVQSLIDQIDVEPVQGFGHIKLVMFPLINTTAEDMAKVLTDMLASSTGQAEIKETIRRLSIIKRESDGSRTELTPLELDKPLRILADKGTNSLIIATVEANIDSLDEIIKLLDGVPLGHEMHLRIFPLKFADAESVQEILKTMFEEGKTLPERAPGGTKTEAVPEGEFGEALVYNVGLAVDKRANILFVSGRPEQMTLAESVVDQLDVPVTSLKYGMQLLFLGEHLDATRVSAILDELFKKRMELFEQTEMGKLAKAREEVFLAVDVRSNALIVSASDENYAEIVRITEQLNVASQRWMDDIRIINCDKTSASDLATKIEELWERKSKLKQEGETDDQPVIISDQRSNSLVIASSPEDFEAVRRLVEQLESQPLSPIAEIRLMALSHNDAQATGDMLKGLFEERMKQRLAQGQEESPSDRVAVAVDGATNTVLIASSRENFDEMSRIIAAIDVEPVIEGVIRTFTLSNAEASDVVEKVKELFEQGLYHPAAGLDNPISEARQKIAIVADPRSNSIVASASRQNLSIIETLIGRMDGELSDIFRDDTKLIVLEFADAVRLADMLEKLFEGRKADASEPDLFRQPTIIADERSNTLIISGARDSLKRCEDLIVQLDKASGVPTSTFEVYGLQHASAAKLAAKMAELFEKRTEGTEDKATPINIQADEASNSLIASASRDDHALIEGLLTLLDVPSNIARQFHIFPLKLAKAETMAQTLETLFKQQGEGATGRADAIAVQPDTRSNSIVVWASASEMENIAEIVGKLDTTKPAKEMMMRVVRLKQALAEDFAKVLDETLKGGASGDEESAVILSFKEKAADGKEYVRKLLRQDITISPDTRTNSLMVLAPAESMDLLETMILDFDRIKPVTAEIRLFPLANADADGVVERLNDLFGTEEKSGDQVEQKLVFGPEGAAATAPAAAATGAAGEGASARIPLRFTADRRTNTVIASGNAIDLLMVEELVRELDAQDLDERVHEVYRPRFAKADVIASTVDDFTERENELLSELDDATSIRQRADKRVTVVGDEESNVLLLGASQREHSRYMQLVHDIDRPEPQVMISVLIAEVSMDDRFELGVEFAAQDLNFSEKAFVGPNGVIQGQDFDYVGGTDIGAAGVGFGGLSLTISGEDFSFLFRALESQGDLEVLSRPTILVQNNAEGNITIGDRVPIISGTTSAGGQSSTTIQYEEVGIILQVTPHINPDGYVNLEIAPEISQISNQSLQVSEGLTAAVFSERTAETTVTIKDGETVILGGLITEDIQNSVVKIPLLGDIPYIGNLFRTTTKNSNKTELLIVLTVNVLRDETEVHEMSVAEVNRTGRFPDRIKRHPLMQGLRIHANEDLMGPLPPEPDAAMPPVAPERDRSIYGPTPGQYGPKRPTVLKDEPIGPVTERPTYGPKLVRFPPTGP